MSEWKWHCVASFVLVVTTQRAGRKLGIMVQPESDNSGWMVLALESDGDDMRAVLADHAHKLVGRAASPAAAFRRAETYAREWLAKPELEPACTCGEIDG